MKIKKLLAFALAALLLSALVPAYAAPEGEKTVGICQLEEYMNHPACQLTYTNGAGIGHSFEGHTDLYGNPYAQSTDADGSRAEIESVPAFYTHWDVISFEYKVTSELNHDCFRFTVDNRVVLEVDHEMSSWQTFSYHLDGGYEHFNWIFFDRTDELPDEEAYVCIRNVLIRSHLDLYNTRAALNKGGGGSCVSVTTEANGTNGYAFSVFSSDSDTHDLFLYSTNGGVSSSVSTLQAEFSVEGATASRPMLFSFDYAVSCELNYDFLIFKDNGNEVARFTGIDDFSWYTYDYQIASNGLHTFTWEYQKDVSLDAGSDMACIDNMRMYVAGSHERAETLYNGLNAPDSDAALVFNTPAGYRAFVPAYVPDQDPCFASNNRFLDGTSAALETVVNMAAGEQLKFDFLVSSEPLHDQLCFYANDVLQENWYGVFPDAGGHYTFTAPTTGTYRFRWEYAKDSSGSMGKDCAWISNVRYIGSYHNERTLSDALVNSALNERNVSVNSVTNYHYFNFLPVTVTGEPAVMSLSRYYDGTESILGGNIQNLAAGDTVHFEYMVLAESSDKLIFAIAGDNALEAPGDIMSDWHEFNWVSGVSGAANFSFTYQKDSSLSSGLDCVYVRNFCVTTGGSPSMPGLDEALNAFDTDQQLHFSTNGAYPFVVGMDDSDEYYAGSSNQGVNNSTSSMTCAASFQAGDTVTFRYTVDSEQNYDWFNFKVDDGINLVHESGSSGVRTFSLTIEEGGNHILEWSYTKDSSQSFGDDMVRIYNVKVTHGSGGTPGDANGDGTVDVTDALLVLRYAMGLVNTIPGMSACDVNGDGVVDMTDALVILRIAMGII